MVNTISSLKLYFLLNQFCGWCMQARKINLYLHLVKKADEIIFMVYSCNNL